MHRFHISQKHWLPKLRYHTMPQVDRPKKLKAHLYLGIDVKGDTTGDYNATVIRSNCKADVHVIIVDTDPSRFFYQAIIGKPCPRKQSNISFVMRSRGVFCGRSG